MNLYNFLFLDKNKQSIEHILNGLSSNLTNKALVIENTTFLKILLECVPDEAGIFVMELLFDKSSKYYVYKTRKIPQKTEIIHLFDLSLVALLSLYLFGGLIEKDPLYRKLNLNKERMINAIISYSVFQEEQRKLVSEIRRRLEIKGDKSDNASFSVSVIEKEIAKILETSPSFDNLYLLRFIMEVSNKVESIDSIVKRKLNVA